MRHAGGVRGQGVAPFVADHPGAREIDPEIARGSERQAGLRLAAAAGDAERLDERFGMVWTVVPAIDSRTAGRHEPIDDGM